MRVETDLDRVAAHPEHAEDVWMRHACWGHVSDHRRDFAHTEMLWSGSGRRSEWGPALRALESPANAPVPVSPTPHPARTGLPVLVFGL